MNETTPASQLVRKRQLAKLMSVSPRTVDGWVSKRMIPFIEPNPRLHLFDPAAVKSALLAQFAVPANMPADAAMRAGAN
jgi:hypothetical protein